MSRFCVPRSQSCFRAPGAAWGWPSSTLNRERRLSSMATKSIRWRADEIIEILKDCQTGLSRIRGLLPQDAVVAHKTGTIGGSTNDTGIVYLPYRGEHLLITVFTKDAKATAAERDRVIAEISRYAYDYFIFNPGSQ